MYTLAINNAVIVSRNYGYVPFIGSICVQDTDIAEIRRGPVSESECGEWIDGSNKILMPGLVNCHNHGDMTLARGLGDDLTLLEQIRAYSSHNWFYDFITDEERYNARQLAYCEALLCGTTFICENMYWGLGLRSIDAMKETGIKGALVEDIRFDFSNSDSFVADETLREFSAACKNAGLVPVIGLPAEEDFETERLQKIFAKLQGIDALQTLHLAENQWRVDIIKQKYGMTPIEYLSRNGLLHERLIGSHVVFANEKEIGLLKEAHVRIANTPLCEMKIADGIAPIPEMTRQGLTLGLGTDGALWNNSSDIFREMKGTALLHTVNSGIRCLSKNNILDMATAGGAAVFGKEAEFGLIQQGMKADMILIDTNKPHLQPLVTENHENVSSAIIFSASGRDVSDVFINGKRIVKNGTLTTVNVSEIIDKVRKTAQKIAEKM